jgi:cell division septation protein DedD
LTFYETLPKGSKAVIGSGLNLQKPAERFSAKAASPAPAVHPSAKPTPAEPGSAAKDAGKAAAKGKESAPAQGSAASEAGGKGKFAVQVASYQTKKEAEAQRERLTATGAAAYVVESKIPDKGTWYRVRIGKHLEQQAAHDLAAKAGKGAIVIPE